MSTTSITSTARIRALEQGSDLSLTTCIVAAILAVPSWFWFAWNLRPTDITDETGAVIGTSGASPSIALVGGFALFATVLCAVMWGAHVVLSTLRDAEVAHLSQ